MNDPNAMGTKSDAGLLILRVGLGICFILLLALKQSNAAAVFVSHPGRLWPLVALSAGALFVVIGFFTRVTAIVMAFSWVWAMYSGLHGGQRFVSLPYRSILFLIVFATLALTGPGRFSLDERRNRSVARDS